MGSVLLHQALQLISPLGRQIQLCLELVCQGSAFACASDQVFKIFFLLVKNQRKFVYALRAVFYLLLP